MKYAIFLMLKSGKITVIMRSTFTEAMFTAMAIDSCSPDIIERFNIRPMKVESECYCLN